VLLQEQGQHMTTTYLNLLQEQEETGLPNLLQKQECI